MLQVLKDFFTRSPKLPTVRVTGMRDGLLSLQSDKTLELSEQMVETSTPAGRLKTKLCIQSYDRSKGEYLAAVDENDPTLESLDIDLSNFTRVAKVLRVSSRDLPLYTALTEEISLSGLRISSSVELAVGRTLTLKMEFDCPKTGTQTLPTVVEWSASKSDGSWHSGLRFQELDQVTFRRLAEYIRTSRR